MFGIIAISLSILTILAGLFMLAKSRKESLGKMFTFSSYAAIIGGVCLLIGGFVGGSVLLIKKGCTTNSGCYMKACNPGSNCSASMSGCRMQSMCSSMMMCGHGCQKSCGHGSCSAMAMKGCGHGMKTDHCKKKGHHMMKKMHKGDDEQEVEIEKSDDDDSSEEGQTE